MSIEAQDLVDFVWKNQADNYTWTKLEIAHEISESLKHGCCCVDELNGVILGIVIADLDTGNKIFHVKKFITIDSGSVCRMLNRFKKSFPGYIIEGYRNGKLIRYSRMFRFLNLFRMLNFQRKNN